MNTRPFCVICLLVLCPTLAWGQVLDYSASTVGESWARGASDMMRSSGDRNLSNSQAAINLQDAYSAGLDNQLKSTSTFFEKRAIHDQYMAPQIYEEEQRRQRNRESTRLQPLATTDFDRTTGAIAWPGPLRQPQYDQYRQTYEEVFAARARTGAATTDEYMAVTAASKAWRELLAKQQNDYPRQILSQLVRFVLKLDREIDNNLT